MPSKIEDVDAQMDSIREQMDISNQISEAISSPHNLGIDIDEVSHCASYTCVCVLTVYVG